MHFPLPEQDPLQEIVVVSEKIKEAWAPMQHKVSTLLAERDISGLGQYICKHVLTFNERIHTTLSTLPPCRSADLTLRSAYNMYLTDILCIYVLSSHLIRREDEAYNAYERIIDMNADDISFLVLNHLLAIDCLLKGANPSDKSLEQALEDHIVAAMDLCMEGSDQDLATFLEKTCQLYEDDRRSRSYLAFIISRHPRLLLQTEGFQAVMEGVVAMLMDKKIDMLDAFARAVSTLKEQDFPKVQRALDDILSE